MNTADFEKNGYKLVSYNPANGAGNLRVLTPTGSQNVDPAFAQKLIQGGTKINPAYIPDDIAQANPNLKTQDYLASQGLGGIYTSRLGNPFNEDQYNTETQNAQIEKNADVLRSQSAGVQFDPSKGTNAGTGAPPNTAVPLPTTGQPSPATVQAQPFTNPINAGGGVGNTSYGPSVPSKYEQGFNQAQSAGVQSPDSASSANGLINTYAPSQPVNTQATTVIASNQNHQKYLDDFAFSQNSQNQGQTLTQQYTALSQQLGIPALDTQLLNMKNVMDGSEQDIRDEITKAGGFATDSQVLALTDARNKTMLQNYNNLVQTRNNMQNNLTTMIGLAEKDRTYASQQIDRQLDFDKQQIEYTDKMLTNAQDSLTNNAKTNGWDAVYNSAVATGDPQAVARINSTMGDGFDLKTMAEQAQKTKAQAEEDRQLSTQLKTEQIKTEKAQQAKIYNDINKVPSGSIPSPSTPQGKKQLAQSQSQIQQIDGLLSDSYLSSAVGPNYFSRISPTNFFTGGKSNFIAGIDQLTSQLNLNSLIDAKSKGATFGALSDSEGKILANAATKINGWAIKDKDGQVTGYNANEKDFKTELDKINNFAKLDYVLRGGNPDDIGVQVMSDGKHIVKNSDGSLTQLD